MKYSARYCCVFRRRKLEDVIRDAVGIGGDSDTIGAMAGSIAEAYYGVPIELEEKALSYLPNDLQGLCHAFRTIMKKRR